jgi:hypothetical protein
MRDKTELQTEVRVMHGVSSAESAVHERLVMLAVNTRTGEVDYDYIQYDLRNIEETQQEQYTLIDGWEFKPFKVILVT